MNGEEFEKEVRNIARALWGSKPGSGASRIVDGRERDCIFEEEFVTHYIECTTSRKLEKVKKDVRKMTKYRRSQKGRTVKLWEITLHEPTEHQNSHCRQNDVDIMSLSQFKKHIIDAREYIELRKNYAFGSATDPQKQSIDVSGIKYQPVAIRGEDDTQHNISVVSEQVADGEITLLLGDYGMGKSINIREAFNTLVANYFLNKGVASPVPVVLNLREHWGQSEPEEVLERHARSVGMSNTSQLVRAFNAGRIVLFLDGFDEIGDRPWRRMDREGLKTLRMRSVRIVKKFVEKGRGKVGMLIAGRPHFFDSLQEMRAAFGLREDHNEYELDEFTEQEAKSYLKEAGIDSDLPDWLPRRPLLLASLVGRDLLQSVISKSKDTEPAQAWNDLVEEVCHREAQIHEVLDAGSIRRILEHLATNTRSTGDGLGPVSEDDIAESFKAETGAPPDNSAKPLLQRLPGLSVRNPENGSRSFIDDQMVDILRAGEVYRFIENPYQDPRAEDWAHNLHPLGVRFVAGRAVRRLKSDCTPRIRVALDEATNRWHAPTLALDILAVLMEASGEIRLDLDGIVIRGGSAGVLDLSTGLVPDKLHIADCTIEQLVLPVQPLRSFALEGCIISEVIGASRESELPEYIKNCEVENYDKLVTNSDIMSSSRYSLPVKIMLTVLKKIYTQKGRGRRHGSLFRGGIDEKGRKLVPDVLSVLRKYGLIFDTNAGSNRIWHPKTNERKRVEDILSQRSRSGDPIFDEIESLAA